VGKEKKREKKKKHTFVTQDYGKVLVPTDVICIPEQTGALEIVVLS